MSALEDVVAETAVVWRKRARFIIQQWRNDTPDKANQAVENLKRDIVNETNIDVLHMLVYELVLLRDDDKD